MRNFSTSLKKLTFRLKTRINLLVFFLSLVSLAIIFLNLIGFNNILGLLQNYALELMFYMSAILSTIFVVIFLPTYPIFFILLKEKKYNILEKLSFTIILNLVYYILAGYIGSLIGLPLTGFFFFFTVLISFLFIVVYLTFLEFKNPTFIFLKPNKRENNITLEGKLSLFTYIKKTLSLNAILLVFFLGFVCLLYIVKFSYFYGTDAMLHIFIIKKIKYLNYLPIEEYYGSVGFHLFGAIIHFFSGIDIILIPKFFVFYTYPVSALIFYNLLMRIFKNPNLAFFGVFILEFFAIGFDHLMYQFWPTSLSVIQCLFIFFLLYVRFENFIKLHEPSKDVMFHDMKYLYSLITLVFVSSILTHALIAIIFHLSFMFIYVIYFLKSSKRGIDLFFLAFLLCIFLFFYNFYLTSDFFFSINPLNIPFYLYIISGIIGILIIWQIKRSIHFTHGRFKLTITGKKGEFFTKIEDTIIVPLSFIVLVVFTLVYIILNILLLDIKISDSLLGFETVFIGIYAYWGILLFQKKPQGKVLIIWGYGLAFIFIIGLFIDLYSGFFISGRIAILLSPFIAIGFISYFYKMIKIRKIGTPKIKILILTITVFSFCAYFYDQLVDNEAVDYNFQKREVNTAIWFSEFTNDKNVIITEFGGNKLFFYYDYPFDEMIVMYRQHLHYFILNVEDFFPPNTHINSETGENLLQELKKEYNTNVYIILDDDYEIMSGWDFVGKLTREEMEQYYNMDYLNKIVSTKSESGIEVPYYWVI